MRPTRVPRSALSFDTQPPSGADIRALRTRLDGDLIVPEDPRWDESCRAFAVALVESADDVEAVADFARVHGLRLAPRENTILLI